MNTDNGPLKRLADGYREMAASNILMQYIRAHALVRANHADDFLQTLDSDAGNVYEPSKRFHDTQTGKHSVRFHWGDEGLVGIEIVRIDGKPLRFSDLRDSSEFPMSWLLQQDAETMEDVPPTLDFDERIEEAKRRYRQGKSPLTAEHLAAVALIYSKTLQQHLTAPNQAVADEFGVPKSTVVGWIRKCRNEGFLPPTEGRSRRPKGYL